MGQATCEASLKSQRLDTSVKEKVSHAERPTASSEEFASLREDEDAEREKQQSLLERIDELCDHIQAVDDAFSQATLGLNGSQGLVSSQQFEVLAQRVDD